LFPPHDRNAVTRLWRRALDALLRRVNPPRRPRSNPRVVKRKILKWPAKRSHHQHHPQPTHPAECSILTPN
ncbi:hypothetical protein, partial [Rhodococcus rhodochrous]|uniref:hypothetical protein n=1 Tax=Rhodococcus rhodochrous TaxID=1829 RepID=UPI001C3F48B0